MAVCKSIGCFREAMENDDFCPICKVSSVVNPQLKIRLSSVYPKYYKDVSDLDEIDVYAVHNLFDIQDPSGAIQHASKKLLLSGVRTGGKSVYRDIKEARDTLSRWLELNPHPHNIE